MSTIVDMNVIKGQAESLLSQALSATQDLANHAGQIGQVAWQATLDVVRVNCLDNLVQSFLLIAWTVGVTVILLKYLKRPNFDRDGYPTSAFPFTIVAGITLLITVMVGGFSGLYEQLFEIWNWVGLFHPELYLASEALDKVMGNS